MYPGCIRSNKRMSWGITLADATKLLFVWDHELQEDEHGLWVNLFDPAKDAGRYGGNERLKHVRAIEAGTVGWAMIGFRQEKKWKINRGHTNPYRIVTTRVDSNGIIWGNLKRFEPPRPSKPYRRDYEERT
jgi:hypothetical protein